MIVPDASAILEVLLQTELAKPAERVLFTRRDPLLAPHVIDLEVLQVLRRFTLSGEMTSNRAKAAISDFRGFAIHRYPHELFANRIWEFRHEITAYDAAYVALAEHAGATFATSDARLAKVAVRWVQVELIS